MLRALILPVLWVLTALPLAAQDVEVAARVISAFETWLKDNGGQRGAIAVAHEGTLIAAHGIDIAPDTPLEMASLSKAITGTCVAELVREGRLTYETRFDDVIGRGPAVSVAQLLAQTGGIRDDVTQALMIAHARTGQSATSLDVLDALEASGKKRRKAGKFRYNNVNYALLGLMIEDATSQSYRAACSARVLAPAGVKAPPSPLSEDFLPWGGWHMSVADYSAFFGHWFAKGSAIDQDPFARPHVSVGWEAFYAQGMFFRTFRKRHNYWHHGALCFEGVKQTGSFAVSWMGGWRVVVAYDTCPNNDMMFSLDQAMTGAVFQ